VGNTTNNNAVLEKSYAFALEIVRVFEEVRKFQGGVIARQLLRAGTSVGANVEEGVAGQTHRDFTAKMSIASKEVRECHYWLRLLRDANAIPPHRAAQLLTAAEELIRLLTAIVKTAQKRSVIDPLATPDP
jgi:four helix bundle protein